MRKKADTSRLALAFGFALFAFLVLPYFFPTLRLSFFVPFLILTFYKCSFGRALWLSLGCGLFLDLFSDEAHLGIHALSYVLATTLLYGQKKHFFEDHITTLPTLTFLFVEFSTLTHLTLRAFFGGALHLSLEWAFTDLLIYPAVDALYAFALFAWHPLFVPKQTRREYFFKR